MNRLISILIMGILITSLNLSWAHASAKNESTDSIAPDEEGDSSGSPSVVSTAKPLEDEEEIPELIDLSTSEPVLTYFEAGGESWSYPDEDYKEPMSDVVSVWRPSTLSRSPLLNDFNTKGAWRLTMPAFYDPFCLECQFTGDRMVPLWSPNVSSLSKTQFVDLFNEGVSSSSSSSSSYRVYDPRPKIPERIRILTLDGGGIRGLATLQYLKAIQDRIGGGKSLVDEVDVLGGVSTGAILTYGLSAGVPLKEMESLYLEKSKEIFKKRGFLSGIRGPKYSPAGLEKVLRNSLGKIKNKHLPHCLITLCADVEGGSISGPRPVVINSWEDSWREFEAVNIILGTTAAPGFFPTHVLRKGMTVVDGGVIATNPAVVATAEATRYYKARNPKISKARIHERMDVVSIGTGINIKSIPHSSGKDKGSTWLFDFPAMSMQQSSLSDALIMSSMLEKEQYTRLNFRLKSPVELDTTNTKILQGLQRQALENIKRNPEEIDKAAKQLTRPKQERDKDERKTNK